MWGQSSLFTEKYAKLSVNYFCYPSIPETLTSTRQPLNGLVLAVETR